MSFLNPLFYAVVLMTVVLVGSQMVLSVQHSSDGQRLEVVDQRIEKLNEEVIVASENIAIFRSAGYVTFVAENRLGLKPATAQNTIYVRLKVGDKVTLPANNDE